MSTHERAFQARLVLIVGCVWLAVPASKLLADECTDQGLGKPSTIDRSDIGIVKKGDKVKYSAPDKMKIGEYWGEGVKCETLSNGKVAVTGRINSKVKDTGGNPIVCEHHFVYGAGGVADVELWFFDHGASGACKDHKDTNWKGHAHSLDGEFHGGQAHGSND